MFGKLILQLDGSELERKKAKSVTGSCKVLGGTENLISIGENSVFSGDIVITGSGNKVVIGNNCDFNGKITVKGDNQTVHFGDHSTAKRVSILCQENCDVIIGKWCMLSRGIEIRTTDAHSIIDRATKARTNLPGSVSIGAHVWIGANAMISKGARIAADTVVGAGSFVNGQFDEESVLLAGVPAQIRKRGLTWSRSLKFNPARIDDWREDV
ncbi:acyltransferase [Rhizobium herbae]|uniref:Acetyltransferase-like isoleucine patch superfamily enzyme n=1 Tax=Rhizobium herbae TaxID=508661 RepID=A0ABS4ET34_9HYPH|nr:hypothetical protein [Rhizobium herbae]MBP1861113.1 acetyltransferase-like isoleucine patch superfamily enzyme [Rhizobium herbae]